MQKSNIQLLFIKIVGRGSEYKPSIKQTWEYYTFAHIKDRWSSNIHWVSPDKTSEENCYHELRTGHTYLVVSKKIDGMLDHMKNGEVKARWVWAGAIEMTESQLSKVYSVYKKTGSLSETRKAIDKILYPNIDNFIEIEEFEY